MKATGIVRRIDDLGRVVIPKEIRRTQHIRVGDPLEIYVSGEGEVIFKKYSPLAELSAFVADYAEVLYKNGGISALIADRDTVISAAGNAKEACDKRLTQAFVQAAEQRRIFAAATASEQVPVTEHCALRASAVCPVLCQGDVIGAVAMVSAAAPTEREQALLLVAAAFLGKQMEE